MPVRYSFAVLRALLLCGSVAYLTACGDQAGRLMCALPSDGRILAVGDSLTNAYGADQRGGWAEQLQDRLSTDADWMGVKVVVEGVNGEQTTALRARLPALLTRWQPQVVILTSGGNDFIRQVDEQHTVDNLHAMAEEIIGSGALPVVFAVPEPGLAAAAGFLSDHSLFEALESPGSWRVIKNVVSETLADPTLRADRIHPNSAGYARMAEAAQAALADCR